MCIKEYLEKNIMNLYFRLKGIGITAFIPILGLYIFIPMINLCVYAFHKEMKYVLANILEVTQYFIPLLSVWWILFVLAHYVEAPMHELLYLKQRIKLGEVLELYGVFLVLMLPLFIVYTILFPELWWLYLKLVILNLVYLATAYCLAFLFGKRIPAVIAVVFCTAYIIMEYQTGLAGVVLMPLQLLKGMEFMERMCGYLILIVVLMVVGSIANYFYPERNKEAS